MSTLLAALASFWLTERTKTLLDRFGFEVSSEAKPLVALGFASLLVASQRAPEPVRMAVQALAAVAGAGIAQKAHRALSAEGDAAMVRVLRSGRDLV